MRYFIKSKVRYTKVNVEIQLKNKNKIRTEPDED